MRTIIIVAAAFAILATTAPTWAAKTVPAFNIKNVDGQKKTFDDYAKEYELIALIFWNTACEPCKEELVEINKFARDYDGFGVVAVSTDTARTSSQVKPYFIGQGFDFESLLDIDGELQRALGVPGVPYSFLVTAAGDVIWEHSGYRKGDEKKLKAEIEKFFAARVPGPDEANED